MIKRLHVFLLLASLLLMASKVQADTARQEHMKNKRAFDRVKHNPGPIEGEGPFPSDGNEDDWVEYTGVDGEKRRMPRDEMQKLLEQQQEDLQSMGKDGKMTKTQQGKARLDELREKDPRLAHLIDTAEAVLHRLTELGLASGKIQHLSTIEDPEDLEKGALEGFRYRLALTVKGKGPAQKFEVNVEGGKGITGAWRVEADGSKVALDVPPLADTDDTPSAFMLRALTQNLKIVLLVAGLGLVLGGAVLLWYEPGGQEPPSKKD